MTRDVQASLLVVHHMFLQTPPIAVAARRTDTCSISVVLLISQQNSLKCVDLVCCLGNSSKGIILCRHADVLLKSAAADNKQRCWIIVCKVSLSHFGHFTAQQVIRASKVVLVCNVIVSGSGWVELRGHMRQPFELYSVWKIAMYQNQIHKFRTHLVPCWRYMISLDIIIIANIYVSDAHHKMSQICI